MKTFTEYINDNDYIELVTEEYCNIIADNTINNIINESFKSSIVQKLAKAIYDIEKGNNERKIKNAKDNDERYGTTYGKHKPDLINFSSIFGPRNYGRKNGLQGLKWSEITDNDFKEYNPDDKALHKLIKQTYGKKDKNADFIIIDKNGKIVNFIKAYNTDSKNDSMYYFEPESIIKYSDGTQHKYNSKLKEFEKDYYTYRTRKLKANEVIDILNDMAKIGGFKVYALEITDAMIKEYTDLMNSRIESQKDVINYDKKSLAELLDKQQARYKTLIRQLRENKLMNNREKLLNDLNNTNKKLMQLYNEVINNPEYIDKEFELGRLLQYSSYAYESYYKMVKYNRRADKSISHAIDMGYDKPERLGEFSKEQAKSHLTDVQEYIKNINKEIDEIRSQL